MSNGAATLVIKDDQVLIMQRGETAPWMPGKWDLPGGTQDENETSLEAAQRELFEETGIEADPEDFIPITSVSITKGKVDFYALKKWKNTPEIKDEHQDMKWVSVLDALDMDIVPGLRQALIEFGLKAKDESES